ncbi:MAG TPA: alpha/beta hydrolase [Solirubrobacteraceae bacterium]|nr:alpha/beta hydrolase [Solirubrobacteraceae bacterium]
MAGSRRGGPAGRPRGRPAAAATALTQHRGGSGPPLVLLHGLGFSWRSWVPVLGALEARHDVLALDLPGFGAAPPLKDRPTPAALADAVEAELDRVGAGAPAVAGNSLGGWIALELARRGRAERVVAIAPSGLELPHERAYVVWLNEVMRLRARLGAPLGRLLTAPLPIRIAMFGGMRTRPWNVDPDEGARELEAFGRSRAFQRTLRSTVGARAPAGLGDIAVPVRIAFGTLDAMLGAYTAPRFAAAIPRADLVELPGVGHVPMADDPDLVARTILDFTAAARR